MVVWVGVVERPACGAQGNYSRHTLRLYKCLTVVFFFFFSRHKRLYNMHSLEQ